MTESVTKQLGEILIAIDEQPWDHALFIVDTKPWSFGTLCAVVDPQQLDPDDDERIELDQQILVYALQIADVQDVVHNIRQQRESVTARDLIEAVIYYHSNDAFLQLDQDTL
jgi:hypothetical protein